MAILFISLTSFAAALLTFFSGFGLGTILMPVVAVFLPVPIAIAVTALVHLMSKIFKLVFLWRYVDKRTFLVFGVPAFIAAIPGAFLLDLLSELPAIGSYILLGSTFTVLPVKLAAGLLLILFATAEQVSLFKPTMLGRFGLPLGGTLSGFFGGLSGHQGAFRSAFLLQGALDERGFIATNAAIAVCVDTVRLMVYGLTFKLAILSTQSALVISAVAAAFLGTLFGARLLKKVAIAFIRTLVGVMMVIFGALLAWGII